MPGFEQHASFVFSYVLKDFFIDVLSIFLKASKPDIWYVQLCRQNISLILSVPSHSISYVLFLCVRSNTVYSYSTTDVTMGTFAASFKCFVQMLRYHNVLFPLPTVLPMCIFIVVLCVWRQLIIDSHVASTVSKVTFASHGSVPLATEDGLEYDREVCMLYVSIQ